MNAKQKKTLTRIFLSFILIVFFHFLPVTGWLRFGLYLVPYLIVGYDILIKAFHGLKNKQPFDESLLMSIATLGAIALAIYSKSGDYVEAIAVMLLYQLGEFFQSYAVGRSRKSISQLMDIAPDYANIKNDQGDLIQVDPEEVQVGTEIYIKPGEKIPIDGQVLEGKSSLDTAALTGESLPQDVGVGSQVFSGAINLNGLLRVKTTKEFGESTASKVMELIEDASSRKSKSENFISKFARIYTPVVVVAALILAILPPIVLKVSGNPSHWDDWIYRALTFLIISCPCALVISIPLSFFAGIGGASKKGILIKGSNYLETLSEVSEIVFDKTGTLTKGSFTVTAIHPQELKEEDLLHLAAHVERYSTHPIADSLRKAYPNEDDDCQVEDINEMAGHGITAKVNGHLAYVGNTKLMDHFSIPWKACDYVGTTLHVARDGRYQGHIVIADIIKQNAKAAIKALKAEGIEKTLILTGDNEEVAKDVADQLSVDGYYSQLLPQDKVSKLEEELQSLKGTKKRLAFVGDGINDAPVLTRADVGIAMGAMGSDAAIEAADVILMDDDPFKIALAIKISKKCLKIVKQNTYASIGIKVFVLILGALGYASMWAAIFADVGVTVLAVLNAIRCMFEKSEDPSKYI
ncbi:Cadmium, zinc and cobalt-transporting ATPase [Urinicoccus massiliensis]|uniref:Cd(2+)-exporting ATPase n=1 Tax=Urinicoccus massiliensis TaxID=1723382 RepID=A0A8H2QS30_9FIRM|nr:heavy metal translocating P-type ATPase [Urinicoccus massiliensis]VFB16451.1 Cadmium, zinc and cobalt-transporting ATPase [Urinicoccus massiliensis]